MKRPRYKQQTGNTWVRVPVSISPAHVHLTPAVIEQLFCDGYRLHEKFRLLQPTQYSAKESITLIGPHGRLEKVPIVGPPRSANQVELSQRDAHCLGIEAPARRSGDLEGTPGILIEGPRARVLLESGVIRALRHVHMSPLDAAGLGVKDQDRMEVSTERHVRRILFRDVLIRVSADYRLELHLDTDDGTAVGLHSGDSVILRKSAVLQPAASAAASPDA